MEFPKTLKGMYNDLNRRFFDKRLPKEVTLRFVDDHSKGEFIDTRCERGSVGRWEGEDGWLIELNRVLEPLPQFTYLTIAHECIHILIPSEAHGSALWNEEVRLLTGKGLFRKVF